MAPRTPIIPWDARKSKRIHLIHWHGLNADEKIRRVPRCMGCNKMPGDFSDEETEFESVSHRIDERRFNVLKEAFDNLHFEEKSREEIDPKERGRQKRGRLTRQKARLAAIKNLDLGGAHSDADRRAKAMYPGPPKTGLTANDRAKQRAPRWRILTRRNQKRVEPAEQHTMRYGTTKHVFQNLETGNKTKKYDAVTEELRECEGSEEMYQYLKRQHLEAEKRFAAHLFTDAVLEKYGDFLNIHLEERLMQHMEQFEDPKVAANDEFLKFARYIDEQIACDFQGYYDLDDELQECYDIIRDKYQAVVDKYMDLKEQDWETEDEEDEEMEIEHEIEMAV